MTSTGSFLIVVGFDGSEYSQAALAWAMDEARQRNGQLRLVTAWNQPPMAWYPAVLETAAGEIAAEESPEQIARTLQGKALESAAEGGVTATGQLVETHSPASAIFDAAKDADLIVVGSRGHGGFPGLHLGSVSTQVVNHAQCPVLVVHSKA
ncbi:MAG TPA: universal stress protein [Arthrobacter sp.]|nr:universal stress protein [Arthrobacter sp.]